MSVDITTVVIVCGLVIHFITFVGIFTKLESRLTKLETTLELLLQNLQGVQFVDRRDTK